MKVIINLLAMHVKICKIIINQNQMAAYHLQKNISTIFNKNIPNIVLKLM